MARLFIAGHEMGDLSEWDWFRDATCVPARTGMDGNFCVDLKTLGNSYVMKDLGGNKTEFYMYWLLRREGTPTYSPCPWNFFAGDEGDAGAALLDTTNYYFNVYTAGSGGTLVAAGTHTIVNNTTYRIELYFKPSTGADGRLVLKINGDTDIDFTGVTSLRTNVRYIGMGNPRAGAYINSALYVDNVIVDDADWITQAGEQPHRISTLVPTSNGAEGSLTGSLPPDINTAEACWRFEAGGLTTDETGNAALTAYGSPTADNADYRQGSACVQLVKTSSQYFKVLDSALPSGFPMKSGETNRVFTLAFWYKPTTLPGSGVYHDIFTKHLYNSDAGFQLTVTNSKLRASWGYSATLQNNWDVLTLTSGKWIHVTALIHGDNKTWQFLIYDLEAGTTTTYTGTTPGNTLHINARDLYIGAYDGGIQTLDGRLDDMRLFPVILTAPVAALVRQNRTTFEKYEIAATIPPSDLFFLKGAADGDIETYGMQDLVGSVESIKAVQLQVRNFATGEPTAKNVTPVVRVNGSNYLGSAAQTPAWLRPDHARKIWEANPYTTSGWTKDELDAIECGVKLTA